MMDPLVLIPAAVGAVLGALIGVICWNLVLRARGRVAGTIISGAQEEARSLKEVAERESAALRATAQHETGIERERQLVAARGEAVGIKEEAVREASRRREELDQAERRLAGRAAGVGEAQERLR